MLKVLLQPIAFLIPVCINTVSLLPLFLFFTSEKIKINIYYPYYRESDNFAHRYE